MPLTSLNDAHLGHVYELMRRAAECILSQISRRTGAMPSDRNKRVGNLQLA